MHSHTWSSRLWARGRANPSWSWVRAASTGAHFRTRSTPGVYHARFKIEESGAGLPPGQTLVNEVTVRLTLEPRRARGQHWQPVLKP